MFWESVPNFESLVSIQGRLKHSQVSSHGRLLWSLSEMIYNVHVVDSILKTTVVNSLHIDIPEITTLMVFERNSVFYVRTEPELRVKWENLF